ncbi:Tetraspanin-6 [Pseudolycoriella hygida]|uniref:Tetraspanin-6 n=1 Tax=Pseudolycoriella hygida TaxID=35572 RepID=A0A9Q0N3B3_9DIPT|nr:Tetraspanin-6 [Pseudolycoriella hygida]
MESPKRKVRVTCLRHTVDALNVLHLIIACLTIVGAIAVKAIFSQYTFPSFSSGFSALLHLPNLWIATAFFLALFSAFGIFATIRNSTKLLNLIIACLMIIGAVTVKAIFRQYAFASFSSVSALLHLPNLWIATAFFLALFSVFGFFGTIKNSTKLLNLYAVAMTLVFVLQLATAIAGFALLPQSRHIAEGTLSALISEHKYSSRYQNRMDWIQQNYRCCGISGPEDWTVPPMSCCHVMEGYECLTGYFEIGCHNFLYVSLHKNLLLIAWSGVVIGLFHVWAIMSAYVLAKGVRQSKTERDIKRWTSANDVIMSLPSVTTEKNE